MEHQPPAAPGDYNQALMELGALGLCAQRGSAVRAMPAGPPGARPGGGTALSLPQKAAPKARKLEDLTVALVESPAGFLIQQRPEKGLLAGLWQPLLWEGAAMTAEQLPAALTALGIHGITEAKPIPKAKHIFSHIEWRMTGYTVTVEAQPAPDGCIWATREQLQTEYTLPGAFKAYKKRLGLV